MIPGDSFTFAGVNSLEAWGIKVVAYDVFGPQKRDRKQQIPFRHGSYDYGKKYYNNRTIRLDCMTEIKPLSKSDMREVIYWLHQKSALYLWDEPDKYYIGELLESVEVEVLPKYIKQRFVLPMICDPFAYKAHTSRPLTSGINTVDYKGTVESPTMIILRNINEVSVSNVVLKAVQHIRA